MSRWTTRWYPWGDTAISLHILQLPPGGAKVGFELREENWSLEIWGGVFCQRSDLDLGKKIGVWKFGGGCSAKGQIQTRGRKLKFGNLGGGCSAKGQIWTRGRKLEFGNLGGGVLPKVRFEFGNLMGYSAKGQIQTRGRKLEFGNFRGGGVLPKVRFGLGEENWSLEIWGGGVF